MKYHIALKDTEQSVTFIRKGPPNAREKTYARALYFAYPWITNISRKTTSRFGLVMMCTGRPYEKQKSEEIYAYLCSLKGCKTSQVTRKELEDKKNAFLNSIYDANSTTYLRVFDAQIGVRGKKEKKKKKRKLKKSTSRAAASASHSTGKSAPVLRPKEKSAPASHSTGKNMASVLHPKGKSVVAENSASGQSEHPDLAAFLSAPEKAIKCQMFTDRGFQCERYSRMTRPDGLCVCSEHEDMKKYPKSKSKRVACYKCGREDLSTNYPILSGSGHHHVCNKYPNCEIRMDIIFVTELLVGSDTLLAPGHVAKAMQQNPLEISASVLDRSAFCILPSVRWAIQWQLSDAPEEEGASETFVDIEGETKITYSVPRDNSFMGKRLRFRVLCKGQERYSPPITIQTFYEGAIREPAYVGTRVTPKHVMHVDGCTADVVRWEISRDLKTWHRAYQQGDAVEVVGKRGPCTIRRVNINGTYDCEEQAANGGTVIHYSVSTARISNRDNRVKDSFTIVPGHGGAALRFVSRVTSTDEPRLHGEFYSNIYIVCHKKESNDANDIKDANAKSSDANAERRGVKRKK